MTWTNSVDRAGRQVLACHLCVHLCVWFGPASACCVACWDLTALVLLAVWLPVTWGTGRARQGKAGCIHMSYHIMYHHISYHISWTLLAYAARVQLTQTANSEARKNHMILHAWLACWMQCNVCLQRIRLIQLTGRRLENSGCIQKLCAY